MQTALVIVDMLNDFVDGIFANPSARRIVGPISLLAERARATRDWVVFYANDAHLLTDVELRVFPPHAMAQTAGAAVIDELRPGPDDVVVDKRFYSAFTDTDLQTELRDRHVGRLVVVGQHTDCCVRHTCYDAFARALRARGLPRRHHGVRTGVRRSSSSPARRRALEYLRTYYGVQLESSSTIG